MILTTTDGTTWTSVSGLPAKTRLRGVACPNVGGLLCAAVGEPADGSARMVILVSSIATSPDTTPPVLTLPGTITVSATSPQGAVVNYTVTATDPDNASSQLTITCSPASGNTFAIGTTTVNCRASDPAGNTTTGSFQVVVKGAAAQISDLITLVDSSHLLKGLQTSLDTNLQAALSSVKAGNTTAACNQLGAFINMVQAQAGKNLTLSQAQQLQSNATQIQTVLAC